MSATGVVHAANLLRGWWGLATAYTAVQAPLVVGLLRHRAPLSKVIASPLLAVPLAAAVAAPQVTSPVARWRAPANP
jgi:hypothetical protein